MKDLKAFKIMILLGAILCIQSVAADVRLPRIFSEGMVIQRGKPIVVWGWANPGEKVSISLNYKTGIAITDNQGNWMVELPSMQAGGPYTLYIKAKNELTIHDVLIGDVWICSGQSNMDFQLQRAPSLYAGEMQTTNLMIRHFKIKSHFTFHEFATDVSSTGWKHANPGNLPEFSAVAYFFAKQIYEKYKIPIGLINASIGGAPVEAWTSEAGLKEYADLLEAIKPYKNPANVKEQQERDKNYIRNWYQNVRQHDSGSNQNPPWSSDNLDDNHWKPIQVPGYWEEQGLEKTDGVVWYRKSVYLSQIDPTTASVFHLGNIVDEDSTFINGYYIGSTRNKHISRRYNIPANLLKEGINTIAIRILNKENKGGFVIGKPYGIQFRDTILTLSGEWKYKVGYASPPLIGSNTISFTRLPVGLYNGMIAPLTSLRVKGIIWYQGEQNTVAPQKYNYLFPALIKDWRKQWKDNNLPFLYVQLPNFMESESQPGKSSWAQIREAQLHTLALPHTAMAVTHDIGEWNDIHPLNKKDVGYRLFLAAEKQAYGNNIIHSGPIYKTMEVRGNKMIITFENVGGGLVAREGGVNLRHFAIADASREFVWAKASIQGNKVIVYNDNIQHPVAVRYAWADNPEGANLYNKEGLPASSFRTDNWNK